MDQRLGVATDDLALPLKMGLRRAARLGFGSVEIGTASAEVNPRAMGRSGRRHVARYVRGLGLSLAAWSADPADAKPLDPANMDLRVEHARAVLEMAADAGTGLVTVHWGRLIEPAAPRPADHILEGLTFLGEYADRIGPRLALRVGDDEPGALAALLDDLSCPALRVCLDSAALTLAGRDVAGAVAVLAKHLALAHIRDAQVSAPSGRLRETNLGRGDVDLAAYLAALTETGYPGPLIVRRTDTPNPTADLAACKAYLEALLTRAR